MRQNKSISSLFKRTILFGFVMTIIYSCERELLKQNITYGKSILSAEDDALLSDDYLQLYDNNTFFITISNYNANGKYELLDDTIILDYFIENDILPKAYIISEGYEYLFSAERKLSKWVKIKNSGSDLSIYSFRINKESINCVQNLKNNTIEYDTILFFDSLSSIEEINYSILKYAKNNLSPEKYHFNLIFKNESFHFTFSYVGKTSSLQFSPFFLDEELFNNKTLARKLLKKWISSNWGKMDTTPFDNILNILKEKFIILRTHKRTVSDLKDFETLYLEVLNEYLIEEKDSTLCEIIQNIPTYRNDISIAYQIKQHINN